MQMEKVFWERLAGEGKVQLRKIVLGMDPIFASKLTLRWGAVSGQEGKNRKTLLSQHSRYLRIFFFKK